MKIFSLVTLLFALMTTTNKCNSKNIYKGRLEIKAICMNYTISLLGGDLDTSLYVREWTDESTGKKYNNVFALGSACTFPDSIKEGDEFYFRIDSTYKSDCAVCLAYYPKPPKKIAIKIVNKE